MRAKRAGKNEIELSRANSYDLMRAKRAEKNLKIEVSRAKRADIFLKTLHFSPNSSKFRSDYLFSFQNRTHYLFPVFLRSEYLFQKSSSPPPPPRIKWSSPSVKILVNVIWKYRNSEQCLSNECSSTFLEHITAHTDQDESSIIVFSCTFCLNINQYDEKLNKKDRTFYIDFLKVSNRTQKWRRHLKKRFFWVDRNVPVTF